MRTFAVDALAILLFAALGRRNHDEGSTVTGVLVVAWPFLAGWTIAWFATRLRRHPRAPAAAARALALAIPVALLLRVATGRGIAPAFIVVAIVFLGLVLVGRRALFALIGASPAAGRGVDRRRARPVTGRAAACRPRAARRCARAPR